MQQLSTLSLVEHFGQTEFSQARSEIYFNGRSSGILVSGKILEAAFSTDDDRCLIFTTDDILFEESLTIALVSREQGVIDIAHVGGEYVSGVFKNAVSEGDVVHFQFIDGVRWTIKISSTPHFRIPFLSDPRGVQRPSGLKTYMTFSTVPL
ncbi:hypothetical protein [Candidatus Pantoea multigeneris]|uniref:Uncharacterized protein n=1 Tax=Candidatus Pantoea multigeneris TaxID=2608357 RepID=A0ABX0RBZ5_9GAMM|nr:hypothetical protein [Pantoea multigeneris]NIF21219.1 hypothetical protein [Pantoea multigeneris]